MIEDSPHNQLFVLRSGYWWDNVSQQSVICQHANNVCSLRGAPIPTGLIIYVLPHGMASWGMRCAILPARGSWTAWSLRRETATRRHLGCWSIWGFGPKCRLKLHSTSNIVSSVPDIFCVWGSVQAQTCRHDSYLSFADVRRHFNGFWQVVNDKLVAAAVMLVQIVFKGSTESSSDECFDTRQLILSWG